MDDIRKAHSSSTGRTYEYTVTADPPRGTMKYTYFTTDRRYAVQFFNDPAKAASDAAMQSRVAAITGRFNPTVSERCGGAKGGTDVTASYFSELFCWPQDIVDTPEYGIICPVFPSRFMFPDDACICGTLAQNGISKRDKLTRYFTSPAMRSRIKPEYLGSWRGMLSAAKQLACAVRRMHSAGLAHTDLSCNNVLIDPVSGTCIIIDIDTLAVPGVFSPMVAGSSFYLAPEVLETRTLPKGDTRKAYASVHTDDYALAVLIYELLFCRHPLMGKRAALVSSDNKSNRLAFNPYVFGTNALFIEHPVDKSNRPDNLRVTINDTGSRLTDLFTAAFVDGLTSPQRRPTAREWERALGEAFGLLQPCANPSCEGKWFILHDAENPVCPHCGTRAADGDFIRLRLCAQLMSSRGQWGESRLLNGYDGLLLRQWHICSDHSDDEDSSGAAFARLLKRGEKWLLENLTDDIMISSNGELCMPGRVTEVGSGIALRTSTGDNAYLIEFSDK